MEFTTLEGNGWMKCGPPASWEVHLADLDLIIAKTLPICFVQFPSMIKIAENHAPEIQTM